MPTINEDIQKRLREITGTSYQFEGDWHAYLDMMGIPTGMVMERILAQAQKQDASISTASIALLFFSDTTRIKNMAPYYLDVQRRDASLVIPATPTPFVWDTEVADTLNAYNSTTGVLTIPFTGIFTFVFSFNGKADSGIKTLYSAAEIFNGSIWVASQYSARQNVVRNGDNTQMLFCSTNRFTAGTQLRFPTWGNAAGVSVVSEVPVGGPAFTIPAARLLIGGIPTE